MGHNNLDTKYNINDGQQRKELLSIEEEKDLGVYTTSDLRPSRQCMAAAARASSVLGWIARNFKQLSINNFRLLYRAYIKPHLKYCSQSWSPYLAKYVACLKRIQRRATQLIPGFKFKPYEDRLIYSENLY